MVWLNEIVGVICTRLRKAIRTAHGRFVLLGMTVGLFYLPTWLGYLLPRAIKGKMGFFLILIMLSMASIESWSKRRLLQQLESSEEDRWLGYLLIVSGTVLFPFCRFALWSQSLVWLIVLVGIAISTWGVQLFYKFIMPTFFLGLTVYPRIGLISRGVWDFFTPYLFLERTMAFIGSWAMRCIGFPATQQGEFITFPEGAVEVGWGCNGLDMAITIAIAGLFMGLLYNQKRSQMIWFISCAVIVSLIANIPRLMLVTIANVYWGPAWFHFWHGFWGGQIFSGVLFTVYYYAVMALIERTSKKAPEDVQV